MTKSSYVPESEIIGARVVSIETWGPITVQNRLGETYEISIVIGHDGPEHEIRRVA